MRLRTKTITTVVAFALSIFVSLGILTHFVIIPSYSNLEKDEIISTIEQARQIIDFIGTDLETQVKDYAFWDDTYDFVQNKKEDYITSNFVDSTFENLQLNFVTIVNTQNDLIYYQLFDLNELNKIEANSGIQETICSNKNIWEFQQIDGSISGLLSIENKPMIFATSPILTSDVEGPIMGGLLFGRYIEESTIAALSKMTNFNLTLNTVAYSQLNEEINDSLLSNGQTIIIEEKSEKIIAAHILIDDFNGTPSFILSVEQERTIYNQYMLAVYIFLVATIFLSVFFGVLLWFLLEREIVKPMKNLASYVKEISLNPNFSPPIPSHTADEIRIVTNAVKDTLKRKLEGMEEVSRMVAHDLRNPLAGIKNATFYLRKKYGPTLNQDCQTMFITIDNCVSYSDRLIQNLLEYSSEIKLDKIKTSPKKLIDCTLTKFVIPENIKIINEVSDEESIMVDPSKIKQVFTNLISNGIDALQEDGTLKITSKKDKGSIIIDFYDTGIGMPKEVKEKLWTPFFTTKAKGLGIGLSICKRIIDAHNGKIEVESAEGLGTHFLVFLPKVK